MVKASTARYDTGLEEYTVVDTDVHLRVPISDVVHYLDEPHKSHARHNAKPSGSWNRYKGGKIDRIEVDNPDDIREGLCEQFSIDYPILNPSLPWLSRLPQPEYATSVMKAYNNYLVDAFLDEDDSFFGLIQISPNQPSQAAEEIDRMGDESQVVGVYIVPLGPEVPLGDPRYDQIYQAAEDHNLTIAYHSGTSAFVVDFPKQHQGFNEFVSIHTLGHLWGQMQTVVSLMEHGTPVKFPNLNFTFLEAGIGWLPGLMFRLNKEYSIRADEMPLLEKLPEEYIKEFYISSQPIGEPKTRSDVSQVLDLIDAPDVLMFSSDYPHWDFDNPSELFGHIRSYFDEEAVRRILSENAKEAFHLPI